MGGVASERKALRFNENRANPVQSKLFCRHAVVMEEAHGGEGSSTEHTYPGQQLRVEIGFEGEVQGHSNNHRQYAAYALAKVKAEEYGFFVIADFLVDFNLQI